MPEPPASGKGHAPHRGRYKEKFASMREKHDKATRSQEVYQKQLEIANAKIKKLAAENELLLDALVTSDKALLQKYFPEETTGQVIGHPAWFERERDRERERERMPEGPQHHPNPNPKSPSSPYACRSVQPPPHIVPSHASPYEENPRMPLDYRPPGGTRIGGSVSGSGQSHPHASSSRRGPSSHRPQSGLGPIDRDREGERYLEREGRDGIGRIGGERDAPLERQRPPREGPPEPPILTSTFAEPHPPMHAMPPPSVMFTKPPFHLVSPPPPQHPGYPPSHYSPGPPLPPPHQHPPHFDPQEMQMQLSPQLLPPNSPPVTLTPQGNGGSSFGRFHVVQRDRRREDDPPPPPPPPVNPNHTVDLGLNTFIPHGEGGRR
ncbi:hypothetical protein FA13DRAFT_1750835, partial [Coprinellus micaceus]